MVTFDGDDDGYVDWLAANPDGYVLNTTNPPSAGYLKLHRARCHFISVLQPQASTWTCGDYIKVCGSSEALRTWSDEKVGASPDECSHCA